MDLYNLIDIKDLDHSKNEWQNIQAVIRKSIKYLIIELKSQKDEFNKKIRKLEKDNEKKSEIINKLCDRLNSLNDKIKISFDNVDDKINDIINDNNEITQYNIII